MFQIYYKKLFLNFKLKKYIYIFLKASERLGGDYKRKRIIWLASEGWDRNNEQVI